MRFGDKLKKYREFRGMTMTELARFSGLSQQAISMYERNQRKPLNVAKNALAMALRINPRLLDDDKEVNK